MSDTIAKTSILLEVGAGVDEAAFKKTVAILKKTAKDISKDLKDLQEVSDGSMKKIQGVFSKGIDAEALKKIQAHIKNTLDAFSKGVDVKSVQSAFKSGLQSIVKDIEEVEKKAVSAAKSVSKMYEAEAKAYPKSIGKAATHYEKAIIAPGGLTESAATKQLAGFVQNLAFTANKLRSFDAAKYAQWEKKIDFDKIMSAEKSGIVRFTKDGFKATGLNLQEAYKTLHINKAQQTDFARFSGISDYKSVKSNIDNITANFTKELQTSFKKSFHALTTSFSSEKFSTWYPQLQKATKYQQKLPTVSMTEEARGAVSKAGLTNLSKGLVAGDLKIVSGELRILTENGLKAMKMTEEFAIANGFLKKSFIEQNLIKSIAETYGYSEASIKKALNSVKKEAEQASRDTGKSYKEIVSGLNLYESTLNRLTTNKVKLDPFRESSAGFQKGMADLRAKYSSDTTEYRNHAKALSEVEKIINKTAERMNAMGQNGDAFRANADRFAMAQDHVAQKLKVTNNVLETTANEWKRFTKVQTDSQKIAENISKKSDFTGVSLKKVAKAVSDAENKKSEAILRASAALKRANVDEQRRVEIINKVVSALNVQDIAEKKLLDTQSKKSQQAKVVNPFVGSASGMQKGYADLQAKMSEKGIPAGSYTYNKWISDLKKADRIIENTAAKMNVLGKNGDAFKETANRMAIATQLANKTLEYKNNVLSAVAVKIKDLTAAQDKYRHSAQGMKDAVAQVAVQFGKSGYEHDKWMKAVKAADLIIQKEAALMNKMGQDGKTYLEVTNRLAYAKQLLNREIAISKGVNKELQSQWEKFNTTGNRFSRMLLDLGQKFKTLASYSLAGSFIYGIQNVLRGAVNVVLEFDQALYNLKAITGATDFEMEKFGKKILDLAANTRFSVKEIADSMTVLGQAGFDAQETVQAMDAITALSAATMSDLKSNVDLVTTAIGAFDLQSSDATKVSDIFAAAMNKSKLDLEKLKVAFNYVGPVAHNAGISLEETASMMSLLSNAGIRASTIGTSLRQIIDKLVNPTEEFAKAVAMAGYSMDDFNPQSNKMLDIIDRLREVVPDAETALKYFGVRGASSISVLTTTSSEEFEKMTNAMSQVGTVYRLQGIQMEGALSKTKNFVNNLEVLAVKMGNIGLVDIFKGLVDVSTDFLKSIHTFSENHPIFAFFAKLAFSVAAVGMGITALVTLTKGQFFTALLAESTLLGKLVIDLKSVAASTLTVAGAQTTLNTALVATKGAFVSLFGIIKAHPIGAIITALTVLGGIAYAVADNYNLLGSEVDKANKAFEKQKDHEQKRIDVIKEEKREIETLTGIVKDNTESLESRKVAIDILIKRGVAFDKTLFDNAKSVRDFDNALKDSMPILDKYMQKYADLELAERKQTAKTALTALTKSSKAFTATAGEALGEVKNYDSFGMEIPGATLEDAKEHQQNAEKARSELTNLANAYLKSSAVQEDINKKIEILMEDGSKLDEFNKELREGFKKYLDLYGKDSDEIAQLDTFLANYKFISDSNVRQGLAAKRSNRNEALQLDIKEFQQKGKVNIEESTSVLKKMAQSYTNDLKETSREFAKERDLINEQEGLSEQERIRRIEEVNKQEKNALLERQKDMEEGARKILNAYKETNEQTERIEEAKSKVKINQLKESLVGASVEQKKGINAQIAEEEKALATRKSNYAKLSLDIINNNKELYEALKDTTYYGELQLSALQESVDTSGADLRQEKADAKVDKEIEKEKNLSEARKSREAAEIRAQARLDVKKRDLELVNELEQIGIQYAGQAEVIDKKRAEATKRHHDEVIAIRQDAYNKTLALGADTKKAEWDLLDSKMDSEFLELTTKNAKSAVKRLKDTLELDFEVLSGKEEKELADLELKNIGNLENIEFAKYSIQKKYLDLRMEELGRYIELLEKAQLIDPSISTTDAQRNMVELGNQKAGIEDKEKFDKAKLDEDARKQRLEEQQRIKIAGMQQYGQYTELEELEYSQNQEIEALTKKYTILGQITEEGEKLIAETRKRHAIETTNAMQKYYAYQYQQQAEVYGGLSDLMGEFYDATGKKMKAFFIFQRAMKVAEIIMNTMSQAAAAGSQLGIFGIPMQTMIMAQGMARAGIVAGQSVAELTMAEGGKVPGYSPTPTADNINAKLTAEEWVHPVPTTRYYGDGIMEAVRTRSIPREVLAPYSKGSYKSGSSRFAEGGKADIPNNTGGSSEKDNGSLQIVNILDPNMFDQYMSSNAGQKTLANFISRNPAIIKNALR